MEQDVRVLIIYRVPQDVCRVYPRAPRPGFCRLFFGGFRFRVKYPEDILIGTL